MSDDGVWRTSDVHVLRVTFQSHAVSRSVTARLAVAPHKNVDLRGRRKQKRTTQQHRCPSCAVYPRCHGPGWGGVLPFAARAKENSSSSRRRRWGGRGGRGGEGGGGGECQRCCVLSRAFHRVDARSCPHPNRSPASCTKRRAVCRAERENFALSHVRPRLRAEYRLKKRECMSYFCCSLPMLSCGFWGVKLENAAGWLAGWQWKVSAKAGRQAGRQARSSGRRLTEESGFGYGGAGPRPIGPSLFEWASLEQSRGPAPPALSA